MLLLYHTSSAELIKWTSLSSLSHEILERKRQRERGGCVEGKDGPGSELG